MFILHLDKYNRHNNFSIDSGFDSPSASLRMAQDIALDLTAVYKSH